MLRAWPLLLTLCLFAGRANAQTTFATITGTVTDAAGALVPGVTVTATNVNTGISTTSESNTSGVYTIAQLREGEYRIRAEREGFKVFRAEQMVLFSRDHRRLDIRMEVGDLVQQIEVTAGAALIETETPRISDTRTARELRQLPMNQDNIQKFVALTPGITPSAGTGGASFYGSRRDQDYFSTDGTTNDGDFFQFRSLEWMQELRVDAGNVTAEYGALGNVTIMSKSGTNDVHGSGFWYYNTPAFNARNPFNQQRSSIISHQTGASLGGPIVIPKLYNGRNRSFFFTSAEKPRQSRNSAALQPTVPLERWRRGDFSKEGAAIRDPFSGAVLPNAIIPASQLNPVSKKIQERFYPLPNTGDTDRFANRNYYERIFYPYLGEIVWISRLDQKISSRDSFFARYSLINSNNNPWDGGLPAFGPQNNFIRSRSVSTSETHIFGPNLLNEARFGYYYSNSPREGPLNGPEVVRSLGITGLAANLPDVGGVFKVGFAGIGLQGINQVDYRVPGFNRQTVQFQDHVTHYRGKHALKAGFNVWNLSFRQAMAGAGLFGSVTFANTYTAVPGVSNSGHPYADFMFGVPTTALRSYPPEVATWYRWSYDFFFQDDWKVTPRLTLNLGVRYELRPYQRSKAGKLATFDVASGNIVVPDAGMSRVSTLLPADYVKVVSASSVGLPASHLVHTDMNNIAPRFGFAYRLNTRAATVVRGGIGLYYDVDTQQLGDGQGAPFTIAEPAYTNTQPVPTLVLPQAYPANAGGRGPSTITLPEAANPHLRVPVSYQWNLTVEREVADMGLRFTYIGTLGRQINYSRNYNSPVPDGRLFVDKPRPFPKYPALSYMDHGASHNYHGLTVEAKRQMRHGAFYQVGYTWAKDIGDAISGGNNIENAFDRRRERSAFSTIPAHRLSAMVIYELPAGRNRKFLATAPRVVDALLGGWQASAVWAAQTGTYLTPTTRIQDPTGTAYTTGRNRPLVTIRPDYLYNANISNPTIQQWFDPNAFAAPPLGRYGNAGNSVITGPGQNMMHGGVHKYLRFGDDPRWPKVRLEMTATNVLNHPNWSNPVVDLSAAGRVATINGVGGPQQWRSNFNESAGMRSMQLGVRVEW